MNGENGFWSKLRTGLDSGLSSSKKMMDNAMKKTSDLEEFSILKIDIRRLETRNSELFKDLGLKVYSMISEEGKQSVSVRSPYLRDVLEEIDRNRAMLSDKEKKMEELRTDSY